MITAFNFSEHEDPGVRELFEKHKKMRDGAVASARKATVESLTTRIDQKWIAPVVKTALKNRLEAMNFSETETEDGNIAIAEQPSFTVGDVIELIEQAVPETARIDHEKLQEENHDDTNFFVNTPPEGMDLSNMTIEQADAIVDQIDRASFVSPISTTKTA